MRKTKIEWTEETWNSTTGCTKVSADCKFCYAEAMGMPGYENGFNFSLMPARLEQPFKKKKYLFFKQWGAWGADKIKRNKKANGRKLQGKIWEAYPKAV